MNKDFQIGGRYKNYDDGYKKPKPLKFGSTGGGYSYITGFINEATRLTDEEKANLKEIQILLKKDPKALERYLSVLKTESERKEKMSKREELLSLLNQTEKKIIRELIKGTPNREIPQNTGIGSATTICVLSSIYKKTGQLINYGRINKMPLLLEYLFNDCGFIKGEEIDISEGEVVTKSEELLKSKSETPEDKKNNEAEIKDKTPVEICDGSPKSYCRELKIAAILCYAKSFIEEKCNNLYYDIGSMLVATPDCDFKNLPVFQDALNHKEAVHIIAKSINKLTEGMFKDV